MTHLDDLAFDTIDSALESLTTLARTAHAPVRLAALALLAETSAHAHAGPLMDLAADRDADGRVTSWALRALERAGVALPAPVYRALLCDAAGSLERGDVYATERGIDPGEVVVAARTPELVEQALAWIAGLAPRSVPRLLAALQRRVRSVPVPLRDALVERWLAELPEHPDELDNHLATALSSEYPAALDVCERHWRARALCGDPVLVGVLERWPAIAARLRDLPGLGALLRDALVGPTPALLDAFGPLSLARRLRNAVLRRNTRERAPADGPDIATDGRYHRALCHLGAWEHGAVVLAHLLEHTALACGVERDLLTLWLVRDRAAAFEWISRRLRALDDPDARAELLAHVRWRAEPGDRTFLQRMLDHRCERVRAAVLVALDRLERGPRWLETLRALSALRDPVGSAARTCLVARGDPDALTPLLAAAAEDSPAGSELREAALIELSRHRTVVREHRALFERAMACPRTGSAARARCAMALAAVFGGAARAVVLRAYLTIEDETVRGELPGLIRHHGLLGEH